MKKKTILIVIALAAIAYIAGRMSAPEPVQPTAVVEGQATEYTCSMHPQIRSTNPADLCPICGMALIPVPQDEDGEDDTDVLRLRVSERAMALMEIQTQPAERRVAEVEVSLYGKVDFDETRLADIVVRSDGYVDKLHANYIWQSVRQGETIADIYSPVVVAAMRELLVARNGGAGALDAARARLTRLGLADAQIDAVLKSGETPRTYPVVSPYDGVVQSVDAREGQSVMEGARIVRLADVSNLWVYLEAYESDLAWLKVGQPVQFSVESIPGQTFQGAIVYIDPVVDDGNRTVRLRAEVPNPEGQLKPGMFVTARVGASAGEALVIPATAPLITGRSALVYIRMPGTDRPTFEPREIVLGPRAGDHYIVHEGIQEGDLVVVHGQFKIDSELQIRGRPSMMQPEGGTPPGHEHVADAEPGDRWSGIGAEKLSEDMIGVVRSLTDAYLEMQKLLSADQLANVALTFEVDPAWDDEVNEVVREMKTVAEAQDIAEARSHFLTLTKRLIPLLHPRADQTLYIMHCPMAFDDAGADWIQVNENILNPYFGASMLRCGEILKKIEEKDHDKH